MVHLYIKSIDPDQLGILINFMIEMSESAAVISQQSLLSMQLLKAY